MGTWHWRDGPAWLTLCRLGIHCRPGRTVWAALSLLRDEGLIYTMPQRGSYVRRRHG